MIDDRMVVKAISQITLRSERFVDDVAYDRTYVDVGILDELDNHNHQILYGRRGTGKTHVLKQLQRRLRYEKRSIAVYLDARSLGFVSAELDSTNSDAASAINLFRDICTRVHAILLEYVVDKVDTKAEEALIILDEFLESVSNPVEQWRLSKMSTDHGVNKSQKFSLGGTFEPTKGGHIDASFFSAGEDRAKVKQEFAVTTDESIYFLRVLKNINDFLELTKLRLYIIIDEWSSLRSNTQPYLADILKRTFCVSNEITLKLAAIETRTVLLKWDGDHRVGFEPGADIFSAPHLDEYFVSERIDNILEIYINILHKHIANKLPFDYLRKKYSVTDGATFANELLSSKAVVELSRAAEGVIRDLLNIFIISAVKAAKFPNESDGKIEAGHVVEATCQWFERDKASGLTRDSIKALSVLENELIIKRKTRFFAVEVNCEKSKMLSMLLDARLIHSVWSNFPDPSGFGKRYNVYCLDYGCCTSVIRVTDGFKNRPKNYRDIDNFIALRLDQTSNFETIVTNNLFGAEIAHGN